MPPVDRDAVLDATDLRALATEICGEPKGQGRGTRWHCPNPAHPDEHPSMGIYQGFRSQWRWKCHACGEGGTAIDLLVIGAGTTVREALLDLADRAGIAQRPVPRRPRARAARAPVPAEPPPSGIPVAPAIGELVTAAADLLWQPVGAGALRYLHGRGFADELLLANRVGFDPGPRQLPRPDGLPHAGPGVVFPVLHPDDGQTIYYQLRYLNPRHRRRYDQPAQELAPNPKVAHLATTRPAQPGVAVVCEGFPDALTAAHTGLAAVALLGTAHASATGAPALARRLIEECPGSAFVICFDDDTAVQQDKLPAGQNAALRLADELAHRGHLVLNIQTPAGIKDLNTWWQQDSNLVSATFSSIPAALAHPAAVPPVGGPTVSPIEAVPDHPVLEHHLPDV
ncbi:toprim domain-containing protein [Frankia sp. AgB32]|uniref:toprim domain-containing protein n=1 Tax=Frankia sp. AgB32 TaxID=631119 RepID=UPI00200F7D0E|nr:toprim domain-containing protein [Frankia sp. AgB32]MCK9895020.1 toprim domain-containing protein [Frankia sp. AgB32]